MSAAYYRVGQYYVDTSTPSAPKLYRCTTAGDKTTSVWALVSGGGGIGNEVAYFAITSISNNDFFIAVKLSIGINGLGQPTVSSGVAYAIAKPARQRTSVASETIDGTSVTYSSYTSDNQRTASDGTNTEIQMCFPRYTTAATFGYSFPLSPPLEGSDALVFLRSQFIIKATNFPDGVGMLDGSAAPIYWEENNGRVWARRYNQT